MLYSAVLLPGRQIHKRADRQGEEEALQEGEQVAKKQRLLTLVGASSGSPKAMPKAVASRGAEGRFGGEKEAAAMAMAGTVALQGLPAEGEVIAASSTVVSASTAAPVAPPELAGPTGKHDSGD